MESIGVISGGLHELMQNRWASTSRHSEALLRTPRLAQCGIRRIRSIAVITRRSGLANDRRLAVRKQLLVTSRMSIKRPNPILPPWGWIEAENRLRLSTIAPCKGRSDNESESRQ